MSATKKNEPPKTRQQKAEKPAPARKATRAKQPDEPIQESTPDETDGMGASDATDIAIYCAFRKNLVSVTLNEATGRKTLTDAGGYRIGVTVGDRKALFYNKKAANQVDAIWFARLKAVECAIEWFPNIKKLTVLDEFGEVAVTNRASSAVRYSWVANNKAQEKNFSVTYKMISPTQNKAKAVAAVENGSQFYTTEAKKNYLASRTAGEPSHEVAHEGDEEGHEETPQVRSAKV